MADVGVTVEVGSEVLYAFEPVHALIADRVFAMAWFLLVIVSISEVADEIADVTEEVIG